MENQAPRGYLAALTRGIGQGRPKNAVSSGRNSSEGGGGSSPAIDDVNQLAEAVSRKVEVSQPPKSSQEQNRGRVPINRPAGGRRISEKQRSLLVNHFPVKFDPDVVILQYDIDIIRKIESKPNASSKVSKPEKLLVKNEYLRRQFPTGMSATAYDGDKNIYCAIPLPVEVVMFVEWTPWCLL